MGRESHPPLLYAQIQKNDAENFVILAFNVVVSEQ